MERYNHSMFELVEKGSGQKIERVAGV